MDIDAPSIEIVLAQSILKDRMYQVRWSFFLRVLCICIINCIVFSIAVYNQLRRRIDQTIQYHRFPYLSQLSFNTCCFPSFPCTLSFVIYLISSSIFASFVKVLIDEFFFELHFQCEFHESCWGKEVAKSIAGQNLDRYAAMTLFVDLRKAGIRAHFWP